MCQIPEITPVTKARPQHLAFENRHGWPPLLGLVVISIDDDSNTLHGVQCLENLFRIILLLGRDDLD